MKHLACSYLFALTLFAQSGPTFEVTTIKTSPPLNGGGYIRGCKGGPGTPDPGLWRCTNATIPMLVMRAYDIKRYQLAAPDWMSTTNFEIEAKLAPGTNQDQFRQMIGHLLSDRFKLRFHRGQKEMAVYDLVVAKGGPKLKEWVEKPASDERDNPAGRGSGRGAAQDADGYPNIPPDCKGCMSINAAGKARYHSGQESLTNFANMIGNQLGRPVYDATGLTKQYDITLSWSSGGGVSRRPETDAAADPGIAIEAAVQQQLGLKLVSRKGQVDIIVVDSAEKNPIEN
jgi:uncharacterized protein (TIGR03435 family)